MKSYRVFIGLGANVGDRFAYLTRAAGELRGLRDSSVIWFSPVYESDPWGKADQPKFLNAAGELTTTLSPSDLLPELKAIEQKLGRSSHERWGPREIDLDILLYDGEVYHDDLVTVPHVDLEHRRFALVPLREIAPDVVHPVSGLTITELAAACADQGRVVKTIFHLL
jgi:2-amino-4-hydroxy-6-hydroxymethyldihydropteridine diphosphokinase